MPGSDNDENFLFVTAFTDWLWGPTKPPIKWVPGTLTPGVKRVERQADHSPPSNAKVKNKLSYTSTPKMSSWYRT